MCHDSTRPLDLSLAYRYIYFSIRQRLSLSILSITRVCGAGMPNALGALYSALNWAKLHSDLQSRSN